MRSSRTSRPRSGPGCGWRWCHGRGRHLGERGGVRGAAHRGRRGRPELLRASSRNGVTLPRTCTSARRSWVGSAGSRRAGCRRRTAPRPPPTRRAARRSRICFAAAAPTAIPSCFGPAVGDGRQLAAQLGVEVGAGRRVEGEQDVVRGLVGRGVRPGAVRPVSGRPAAVRRRGARDRDDGVVLGGLQHREAAGGVDGGGLGVGRAEDGDQAGGSSRSPTARSPDVVGEAAGAALPAVASAGTASPTAAAAAEGEEDGCSAGMALRSDRVGAARAPRADGGRGGAGQRAGRPRTVLRPRASGARAGEPGARLLTRVDGPVAFE